MIPEYEERIGFRLSTEEKQKIEQLIREGKAKTVSELIRQALSKFLKEN